MADNEKNSYVTTEELQRMFEKFEERRKNAPTFSVARSGPPGTAPQPARAATEAAGVKAADPVDHEDLQGELHAVLPPSMEKMKAWLEKERKKKETYRRHVQDPRTPIPEKRKAAAKIALAPRHSEELEADKD